jgi:hypothetical protein
VRYTVEIASDGMPSFMKIGLGIQVILQKQNQFTREVRKLLIKGCYYSLEN